MLKVLEFGFSNDMLNLQRCYWSVTITVAGFIVDTQAVLKLMFRTIALLFLEEFSCGLIAAGMQASETPSLAIGSFGVGQN